MLLVQCAACAAPLGLSSGKKCGRCSTRYCGAACQAQHWKEGGHDTLCKKIKKAGGAEQYYANKKYAEAVEVAVEKCADDTKGQTCYICTQALHWKTKEGLVRMCACRGTAGFAHVSCLAEQAKILVAEAEENNLGDDAVDSRAERWYSCSLCEQDYHGAVFCALGWACWKTYLGRPETDEFRGIAMTRLGNGLSAADHDEDALTVREVELAMKRRLGASVYNILISQSNLSNSYHNVGRIEEALQMRRDVYSGWMRLAGEHRNTIHAASNYAISLLDLQRHAEVKSLMRTTIPVAQRVLGESNATLKLKAIYAGALMKASDATLNDVREAVTTFEETARISRRVLGSAHPAAVDFEAKYRKSRELLRACEAAMAPSNA